MPRTVLNSLSSAMKFNGTTSALTFGNILLTNTKVTATMWIKVNQTPSGNFDVPFGYGNTRWFFLFNASASTINFHYISSSVEKGVGPTTALTLNTWFFLAGTYDPAGGANNCNIYVFNTDGSLFSSVAATTTGAIDTTSQPLALGYDNARNYYSAISASELRIYQDVLSSTDLSNLSLQIEPSFTPIFQAPLMEDLSTNQFVNDTISDYVGVFIGVPQNTSGIINRNPARQLASNL